MRAVLRTALVLVVGAGMVVGAVRFPDWQARMAGSGDGATAQAAENPSPRPVTRSAVVCPGPESVGVRKIDATTALSPSVVRVAAPPSDLLSDALTAGQTGTAPAGAGSGSVVAAGLGGTGPLGVAPLTAPGAASVQTSQPRSILLSGNGSLAPGLVAAQTTLITSSDLRGLSTIACQAPSAQTWLVGGAGTTGHRGRVVLSNPTPNAVTVNLTVFGAKGQLSSPAARGIVVKPHKRSTVLLDAIAHGETSPVIHVMASGGVISAALNDTWLDGTTPAGADDVAGTVPGRHLVIPGVLASLPDDGGVLRVAATDGPATVRLRVLGSTGPIAASVPNGEVQIPAHTARDIALTALPVGYSGIELTSTAPVVAGMQVRTAASVPGGKRDIAWSAAEPALSGLAGVALGDLTAPWTNALALTAATTDSTIDVVYVGADGSQSTTPVSVAAGTTTTLGLPRTLASTVTAATPPSTTPPTTAPVSVWLRPRTGSVVAAFATAYLDSSGTMLSVSPLVDAPLRFTPVAVYPLGG